jgi:hypothetical protein
LARVASVHEKDVQTVFGIVDEELDKRLFQQGRILCVDGKDATICQYFISGVVATEGQRLASDL